MKSLLLTFVPEDSFRLLSGEDVLSEYRFNKKQIRHLFCSLCGVQPFGMAQNPDGIPVVAVNVRCLDAVEQDSLTLTAFDGKSV